MFICAYTIIICKANKQSQWSIICICWVSSSLKAERPAVINETMTNGVRKWGACPKLIFLSTPEHTSVWVAGMVPLMKTNAPLIFRSNHAFVIKCSKYSSEQRVCALVHFECGGTAALLLIVFGKCASHLFGFRKRTGRFAFWCVSQ